MAWGGLFYEFRHLTILSFILSYFILLFYVGNFATWNLESLFDLLDGASGDSKTDEIPLKATLLSTGGEVEVHILRQSSLASSSIPQASTLDEYVTRN